MYNAEMQKAFRSIKVPKGFKAHIVDYDKFLTIRFYESQWNDYTESKRFECVQYMINVKKTLEGLGGIVAIDPVLDLETAKDRLQRRRRK